MPESRDLQSIDPERLAALLDGRLAPAEAAAVRADLAHADDETLAAFADAVAISGESASEKPQRSITPMRRRMPRWVYASAAIAAAAVITVLVTRQGRQEDAYALASAIAESAPLPTEPMWSVTRGTGTEGSARAHSTRVGALLVDLAIAVRRRDPATTNIAGSIAAELDQIGGSAGVGARLRTAADTGALATRGDDVLSIALEGSRFADEAYVRAGAWLEAARIANSARDASFFGRYPARASLEDLLRRTDLDAGRRAAIESVIARAANAPSVEANEAFVGLLRSLGN